MLEYALVRILFSSLAAYGHTYPLLPLATAARAAGHEVSFATGSVMHPPLRAAGFEPITAGMSIVEAAAAAARELFPELDRTELTPEHMPAIGATAFGSVLPRHFATDLEPVLKRFKPALVIFDEANSGAELAARRAGVPAMAHGFGPAVTTGFEDHQRRLARVAAELDIPVPVSGFTTPYLDIYPPSLQDPEFRANAQRIALRPVPFSDPTPLPDYVQRRQHDRPLVYLTFGTGFGTAETLRQAIDALAPLELQVLVATGPAVDVAALEKLPDNVAAEAWVPQGKLLPHTDLVVHHGGSGTTLGALSAGIPQLLLPRGADQFANAAAIHASGAGERLLPDEVDTETIAAAARRLLAGQDARQAAGRIATEIASMPSPEVIAQRLPEFAS